MLMHTLSQQKRPRHRSARRRESTRNLENRSEDHLSVLRESPHLSRIPKYFLMDDAVRSGKELLASGFASCSCEEGGSIERRSRHGLDELDKPGDVSQVGDLRRRVTVAAWPGRPGIGCAIRGKGRLIALRTLA